MSFLAPIWLWAGAAIAIPLAIHLLSRGRGQVIPLGTVRFLPGASSHRLRRFRPSGLLRFLLRCSIIASLALALAAPRWWQPAAAAPGEQWTFVDPALLEARDRIEDSYPEIFRQLDAHSDARLLVPGLPGSDNAEAPVAASDIWSLAAEAAAKTPPGAGLSFFVLDREGSLVGTRPDLGREFTWHTAPDPASNRWIERVIGTDDEAVVTIGESDARGTVFRQVPLTGQVEEAEGTQIVRTSVDNARAALRLRDGGNLAADDTAAIYQRTRPLVVAILAPDERAEDAALVRRASAAVAAYLGRPLVEASAIEGSEPIDLLVRLGEGETGDDRAAAVRLLEGTSDGAPCSQSVYLASLPDPWLTLDRCADSRSDGALWRDGWGHPLLSVEVTGDGTAYTWAGRFSPAWSDLSEGGLPHLLLALIEAADLSERNTKAWSDRRAAATGQGVPNGVPAPPSTTPHPAPERWTWLLFGALLVLDRLFVRRVR